MKQDIFFQDNILIALVEDSAASLNFIQIFELLNLAEEYRQKLNYHLELMGDQHLLEVSKKETLDKYRVTATGQERFSWLKKNATRPS
jgi:hypothetical protein